MASGYTPCACRDCMEIAIGDGNGAAYCHDCVAHGCGDRQADGKAECNVPGAYDSGCADPEEEGSTCDLCGDEICAEDIAAFRKEAGSATALPACCCDCAESEGLS